MAMTRQQFPKQLQDGLNAVFGLEYDEFPTYYDKIFDVTSSAKAYEEDVLMVGLGGAVEKPEGNSITYDAGQEAWVARYVHSTIALAFAITEEAVEDGRYGDIIVIYYLAVEQELRGPHGPDKTAHAKVRLINVWFVIPEHRDEGVRIKM